MEQNFAHFFLLGHLPMVLPLSQVRTMASYCTGVLIKGRDVNCLLQLSLGSGTKVVMHFSGFVFGLVLKPMTLNMALM